MLKKTLATTLCVMLSAAPVLAQSQGPQGGADRGAAACAPGQANCQTSGARPLNGQAQQGQGPRSDQQATQGQGQGKGQPAVRQGQPGQGQQAHRAQGQHQTQQAQQSGQPGPRSGHDQGGTGHQQFAGDQRHGPQGQPPLHNPQRIERPAQYHLPQPPAGQAYVVDAGTVFRVNADTLAVIATVGLVSALLTR